MLANYILTAWRTIIRNKMFSFINIFGLAVGFAACILIFLFVFSELRYDKWVPDAERVFRVESTYVLSGRGPLPGAAVPARVAPGITNDFRDHIDASARLIPQQQTVKKEEQLFAETIGYIDQDFYQIFPLTFSRGNAQTATKDSLSIAISESMALKYFGDRNPIGEVLTILGWSSQRDYQVSAVFADIPDESHLIGDMFVPLDEEMIENATPGLTTNWFFPSTFTYVKLKSPASVAALEAGFPAFSDRNDVVPKVPSYANTKPRDYFQLSLINVQDIHLDNRVPNDMKPHGSMFTVYAFTSIAVLLLLIAGINFINLSTARSLKRSKEVALRKTLGAKRRQLITQFMMEAGLIVGFSSLIAVMLVELLLPFYNDLLNLSLSTAPLFSPIGLIIFLLFVSVVAITSGAYPAFFVSRARPGEVLHSNKSGSDGSGLLRSGLVTFQFAISIGLIIATTVLYSQTSYVTGLDLGYDTEDIGVLNLPLTEDPHADAVSLKTELERLPGVRSATVSGGIPTNAAFASFAVFSDAIDSTDSTSMPFIAAGYDYFETYSIRPIAGRTFSEEYGTDYLPVGRGETGSFTGTVILNESAVGRVGYNSPSEAIGKVLRISQPDNLNNEMTIVGVIPDVHFGDARLPTQPMIFYYLPTFVGTVSFKVEPGQIQTVQTAASDIWQRLFPDAPMNLQFIEDIQGAQYDADRRQGSLLTAFSILTVLVASIGLYGLAAFMATRRTKEVGIRKVLGATNMNIISLFIWAMLKPILVANLVAWPVAWYFMNDWLSQFTYRIDMSLLPFLLATVLVSLFGILTVAGRTYSTARAHPADALRFE
ncbi:ABC transporter permease [Kordiimonas sediminis]|uniref:ABC transporter permease n=1 Tax=Kordiimonas sediminis TaxID=1735581 RepID=A0A919EAS1_9PROT|nr:ABC transporter permease [Kordiimonas sediminis]GHF30922.1 ABC transporter permease [Kordiimonas sediminis]